MNIEMMLEQVFTIISSESALLEVSFRSELSSLSSGLSLLMLSSSRPSSSSTEKEIYITIIFDSWKHGILTQYLIFPPNLFR